MFFYLGFLTALMLVLVAFNYFFYITNNKLIKTNETLVKVNSELYGKLSKIQDDVTNMKMRKL